jgi:hypothetical protein
MEVKPARAEMLDRVTYRAIDLTLLSVQLGV